MQGWLQRYKYWKRPITSGRKANSKTQNTKSLGRVSLGRVDPTLLFAVVATINWHVSQAWTR